MPQDSNAATPESKAKDTVDHVRQAETEKGAKGALEALTADYNDYVKQNGSGSTSTDRYWKNVTSELENAGVLPPMTIEWLKEHKVAGEYGPDDVRLLVATSTNEIDKFLANKLTEPQAFQNATYAYDNWFFDTKITDDDITAVLNKDDALRYATVLGADSGALFDAIAKEGFSPNITKAALQSFYQNFLTKTNNGLAPESTGLYTLRNGQAVASLIENWDTASIKNMQTWEYLDPSTSIITKASLESAAGKSLTDFAQPASPVAQPESLVAQPESPLAQPESPLAQPESPLAQPVAAASDTPETTVYLPLIENFSTNGEQTATAASVADPPAESASSATSGNQVFMPMIFGPANTDQAASGIYPELEQAGTASEFVAVQTIVMFTHTDAGNVQHAVAVGMDANGQPASVTVDSKTFSRQQNGEWRNAQGDPAPFDTAKLTDSGELILQRENQAFVIPKATQSTAGDAPVVAPAAVPAAGDAPVVAPAAAPAAGDANQLIPDDGVDNTPADFHAPVMHSKAFTYPDGRSMTTEFDTNNDLISVTTADGTHLQKIDGKWLDEQFQETRIKEIKVDEQNNLTVTFDGGNVVETLATGETLINGVTLDSSTSMELSDRITAEQQELFREGVLQLATPQAGEGYSQVAARMLGFELDNFVAVVSTDATQAAADWASIRQLSEDLAALNGDTIDWQSGRSGKSIPVDTLASLSWNNLQALERRNPGLTATLDAVAAEAISQNETVHSTVTDTPAQSEEIQNSDAAEPNLNVARGSNSAVQWDPRLDAVGVSVQQPEGLQPGQKYWKLVSAEYMPPGNGEGLAGGTHHVYYHVLDENGKPIVGANISQGWPTGSDTSQTKPDDNGTGNMALYANQEGDGYPLGQPGPYTAWVSDKGLPSDKVFGLGLPQKIHNSFNLVYQLTTYDGESQASEAKK